MNRLRLIVVALAFAALPALAQKLEAHVTAVESMDDFMKWLQTKPAPKGVYPTIHEVVMGKKYYLPIFVTGIDPASGARMELVGDMEIVPPSGQPQALKRCCRFTVPERSGFRFAMLSNAIEFSLDPGDPKGVYTFKASVTDGKQTFTAAEQLRYGVPAPSRNADTPADATSAPVAPKRAPTPNRYSGADKRNCLDLPTPADVIKCTEGK